MTDASWYEVARCVGSLVGAVLLWGVFASALGRKGSPLPLLLLMGAVALWYTGEALGFLIRHGAPDCGALSYAGYLARFGISFVPSALLAAFLVLTIEAGGPVTAATQRWAMALLFLPGLSAFLLGEMHPQDLRHTLAFGLYLILALLVSGYLCRRLAGRYETEVHRRFYGLMALALVAIAVLGGIVFAVQGSGHTSTVGLLSFVLFLSPVIPAFVLGYFVYRYSFFRIVVNPALFYSILTGIVLTVYLLGIRRIAEQFRDIEGGFRPEVIEAALLTLLVFLFQPIKNRLQRFISRLFFKARYEYPHLLGELSRSLNVPLALEQRLGDVLDAIGEALKVPMVYLTLFDNDDGEISNVRVSQSQGLSGFPPPPVPLGHEPEDRQRIEDVAGWLATYRRPLDTGELHYWRFVTPLVAQGIQLCIPVLREENVIGFLSLGEKKRGVPFSAEERELLVTLCNQIALAVENARLVEARLALERRMYEAERLSSLGLLSASIAHEVRNPLSSIKAITAVLREELGENRTATEDLGVVLSEVDRLSRVVDRLLRFAKPEDTGPSRALPLKEIVDDVVLILSHEAERRQVALRSEVDEGLAARGSLEDLKEILFNLILNGIQALEGEEGGDVIVSGKRLIPGEPAEGEWTPDLAPARPEGDPGSWVEISVADTGPGIAEDVRPHIFEPFYTTKTSGTGLGLATVRRDAERMNGTVGVRSRTPAGSGTVFVVRLPGEDG